MLIKRESSFEMNAFLIEYLEQIQEVKYLHLARSLLLHLIIFEGLNNHLLKCLDALHWVSTYFVLPLIIFHGFLFFLNELILSHNYLLLVFLLFFTRVTILFGRFVQFSLLLLLEKSLVLPADSYFLSTFILQHYRDQVDLLLI